MKDFTGCKIALYYGNNLVVYLRDNKPGLNFAGMWDFPGGGREGEETPVECIQRELSEEFSIHLNSDSILWTKEYPSMIDPNARAYFFVAKVDKPTVDAISFGEEGQEWKLMDPNEFMAHENAVPRLKARLADYLATLS